MSAVPCTSFTNWQLTQPPRLPFELLFRLHRSLEALSFAHSPAA